MDLCQIALNTMARICSYYLQQFATIQNTAFKLQFQKLKLNILIFITNKHL